jgi:hypothetical protein
MVKNMRLECDIQDRYTPDQGTHHKDEVIQCGVCGENMIAKFSVFGARGFAQAIGGGGSYHDSYHCPNREKPWHKQVVALREEARKTSSRKLTEMLREEADEVLATKTPTK